MGKQQRFDISLHSERVQMGLLTTLLPNQNLPPEDIVLTLSSQKTVQREFTSLPAPGKRTNVVFEPFTPENVYTASAT